MVLPSGEALARPSLTPAETRPILGRMPARAVKPTTPTAGEVPVTSAMLAGVRSEVLHRIDQSREEARADTTRLDGKIDSVKVELKTDIQRLDGTIDALRAELKAGIHEVKADIHEVKASVVRIEVLVEEQNARNKIVLDRITALLSRQNQLEQRVTDVEETVRKLATARPGG
jgi:uncharacterized protein YPO0396